ncbi:neural cell adhesion molecule 1-like [Venturia canescens]|uniref:neural cell adhesion molecule 1-like n=1 Tax=Venturia canescens TaxID=32260 RepID=UPI001C9BEA66|nr:neural cell adhesion molecule 1-like [Venturia canescens]
MLRANRELRLRWRPRSNGTQFRARTMIRGNNVPVYMMTMMLLMSAVALARAEIFLRDESEPTEILELTAVADFEARLPCNIDPSTKAEEVAMVLWYREETSRHPIFSVDARSRNKQTRTWSDPKAFGDRATMRSAAEPTELEVNPLAPEDNGIYRCRVDFKDSPTKNYKINLTVIVLPEKPVIRANPQRSSAKILEPINEGGELSLLCEVDGGKPPPQVAWYLENKLLDDTYERRTLVKKGVEVTVNQLDVIKVSREFFEARLICRASNTELASVSSEIILDINLKPLEVNITNKQNHISALQTYEVECTTTGSVPEAVITWWKGPHQVKHMARNFAESGNMTRSTLSYVPTMEDNQKFLTCRAENPSVPNSALEDSWPLIVHYVPVVTIKFGASLRPNDINEGDDVYFECEVKANPAAYKLRWFKNSKELHQNATAGIFLPSGKSLVLQRVTRTSAGEYSCSAVNGEGTATSRPVTLEVMYAPICKDGSVAQVVGALKHETISLVCGVQSKPPPITFHWTFNNSGELMNVPSNRFTQIKTPKRIANHWHSSRLNYTPNDDMDYGTVSCSATNSIGPQRTPCLFQIIVAGKPYPLQNCTAVQSTGPYAYRMGHEEFKQKDSQEADWLIVRCNEGFDGGLPLTGFELEVYNEESVSHINTIYANRSEKSILMGDYRGPIFEVPGLEPGRNYRLLLYAVNAKGRSHPVTLEPVSLKGVAMYTTGRGSAEKDSDYSLLVACFAGGITAACILIVGITLTVYRRNHPMQPIKTQTHVVHCESKEDRSIIPLVPCKDSHRDTKDSRDFSDIRDQAPRNTTRDPMAKETSRDHNQQQQMQLHPAVDPTEENPDVIPNKVERRAVIFEPNYTPKIERTKTDEFRDHFVDYEYPLPSSVLHSRDTAWKCPDDYVDRLDESSPARPSTLPVHRTHDIYTRSSRVQESCI